jgi:hypothetical protein
MVSGERRMREKLQLAKEIPVNVNKNLAGCTLYRNRSPNCPGTAPSLCPCSGSSQAGYLLWKLALRDFRLCRKGESMASSRRKFVSFGQVRLHQTSDFVLFDGPRHHGEVES